MNQPSPPADPDKEKRLNRILAEYLQRRDAGQPLDQTALLKAYPDLADGLQSYFEGEAMIGGLAVATSKQISGSVEKPVPADLRETVRPGTMESDTSSGFAPRNFGRYELLRPLGEGAMGSVYLANDTLLERKVALKVPKAAGTSNAEFMARFTREAKAAAGLKHPNICSVFDAGEHKGTAYITMDFIDGVPLSRFIGSSKLKSLDAILKMLSTIAEAVGHAHSKGVIHRDLKPGNILVDAELKPNVTDFGLARRAEPSDESRITQEGLLIGTPAYMAPEQVKGEQALVGPQSDIYSLGVILFEMLTCRLPFDGSVPEMLAKVLRDTPPVPSHIRKDLPEDVDDLCLKMLKKLPDQRFSNIAEVLTAIRKLQKKIRKAPVPTADAVRQQSPFEIQKSHVEAMLKKGQYATAIQDLEKLAGETSPGSKAVADWAKATLPIARAESKALSPAGLTALLKTAEQMFQKSDYPGVIQLLEEVPSLRRTEGMEDLLQKARKRETDAEQLLADIKDLEHRQQIDGLEPLVKRFLKLKPGSAYGKRLMAALQSYSKTPAARRRYRYEKGRLQPMPEISFLRQWAVLSVLVGMLSFLSVTYYVLIYLKSGNQTLAVHVDDEWLREQGGEVSLLVDGKSHTISTNSADGENLSVVVTLGEHTFSVKHGDTIVHDPTTFNIEKDGRKVLTITASDIRLENGVPAQSTLREGIASRNNQPPLVASITSSVSKTDMGGNWISLFDGADVSRWSTLGPFTVKDGLLIANGGGGNAVSRDEYSDFELEAEWRIQPGANSGIYYREPPNPSGTNGLEFQISDGTAASNKLVTEAGTLYGVIAAPKGAYKSNGLWNTARIVCRGTSAEHWLNGQKVVAYDTKSAEWKRLINETRLSAEERITFGTRLKGHVLLQGLKGEIAFRSIRIRESHAIFPRDIPKDAEFFDGHAYRFYHEDLSWSEAKAKCESLGGHLPIVKDAAENDFLIKLAQKHFPSESRNGKEAVWLGMTDADSEGNWKWVDGTPVSFANWFQSQPNNKANNEHSGILWLSNDPTHPTGQWCDQPNESENHFTAFVCEWDRAQEGTQISVSSSEAQIKSASDLDRIARGTWLPLIDASTPLPVPEKMSFNDGVLKLQTSLILSNIQVRDVILRAEVKKISGQNIGLSVRYSIGKEWKQSYAAWFNGTQSDGGDLFGIAKAMNTAVGLAGGSAGFVFEKDQFVDLAIAAIGDRISLYVEGKEVFSVFDADYKSGALVLASKDGLFRNVRYQNLDVGNNDSPPQEMTVSEVSTKPGSSPGEIEIPDPNASLQYVSQVHGASKKQLVAWADSLPEGYRPSCISVRATETLPLFDAIATETADRGDWNLEFQINEDKAALESFEKQRRGRRIELYNVFKNPFDFEKLIVWSNGEPTAWWHGGTAVIENVLEKDSKDRSSRRTLSNGATETWLPHSLCADFDYYSLVTTWQPYNECQAELRLSDDELLKKVEEYRKKNWRPHIVDTVLYSSPQKYLAVFVDNPRGEKWDFSPRLTVDEYRRQLSTVDGNGGRPRCVCSREENGEVYYSVIWDYPANPASQAPPISDNDFHAVAPFNTDRAKKYQEACAAHLKLPVEYTNSIGIKFRLIPPGTFTIGSSPEQIAAAKPQLHTSYESNRPERADSEGPQRVVTLTRPFYLGTTEVTQSQFLHVVGSNPSVYSPTGDASEKVGQTDRSNSPAENISWLATGEFCNRLSVHEKLDSAYTITPQLITQTGTGGYRLPTEAEWEFACRAGTTLQFWCGHSEDLLVEVAWFRENNPNYFPSDVAKLRPNPFGLYDMHGNVWEWVHDCWRADAYESWTGAAAVDPRVDTAPENRRVMRGGDFALSAEEARSACRDAYPHDTTFHDAGFRVALSVDAVRQMQTREQAK